MKAMAEIARLARALAETLDDDGQTDAAWAARIIARIAESQIEIAEMESKP